MNDTLHELVRSAAPVDEHAVRALELDELEAELCAAIVAHAPLGPAQGPPARRRPLRWVLPGMAAAAAAGAVILAIALAGGGERLGTSPEQAWAAPALRVANAVPRLLIGDPGWTVERADQFTVAEGEMTFRNGRRRVDLHWRSGSTEDRVSDRARTEIELPSAQVLGTSARVFRYRGPLDDYTALWRSGRYTLELRTGYPPRLSLAEYRRVLGSLQEVGVDRWLRAMPPSVVIPANTSRVVDEMLVGIPLPEGFDRDALKRHAAVRDRYQLGARVAGAVACEWIERWVAARHASDAAAATAAVEAMQSSRRWPILREMNGEGDYPEVVWELADAMEGNTPVPAGKPMSVEQGYRPALGCI